MASSQDAVAGAALPTTSTARALSEEENKPVELSTLDAARVVVPETPGSPAVFEEPLQTQAETATSTAAQQQSVAATQAATTTAPHDSLRRTETEHLGPAAETEGPIAQTTTASAGPVLLISLMLITGARHPYKIDEKYLRNRKVTAHNAAGEFDPKELSGYQLKELIWTDWRSEWEPRPSNPGRIRLIIMGRMIEDKGILKGGLKLFVPRQNCGMWF